MARVLVFLAVQLTLAVIGIADVLADEPNETGTLHEQIDQLFEADTLVPPIAPADDAEFLRRAMLDLHGIIPTADEARAFLSNPSPAKRTELIDRLLASPRYARHFATTFDVLWLERKQEKNIKSQDWYDYLFDSFHEGKPYDQLVREILAGDDTQPATRPTLKFYYARTVEPHALTRDIGRLFFGMDMQCNQCHDSPIVEDYKIGDYYGLYAFVSRTYLFQDAKKVPSLGEKPDGEANFKSVFTGESADKVVPKLPRGPALVEPVLLKGEEYSVKPAKNVKPIPKHSRRAALAERGVDGSTEMFDRNAVNRLWAHLMGRGLVHPVELHHPDNPPSHPAVLDLLVQEFREYGCDVRYLLREIALTRTYARACELPSPQSLNATAIAQRSEACQRDLDVLEKQAPANGESDARRLKTLINAKRKSLEEAQLAADYLTVAKTDAKQAEIKWELLVRFWEDRGDVVLLKPLSPESFALSMLQATGAVDSAQEKSRVTFQSKKPKEWTAAEPADRPRVEAMFVERLTYTQFSSNVQQFIGMYGDAPGADFGANLNQALFFGNAGVVEGLLKPVAGNLTDRLTKLSDPLAVADELYLSVFGRHPTKADESAVAEFLKDRDDRAAAIQELTWSLMSSNEFRFNH